MIKNTNIQILTLYVDIIQRLVCQTVNRLSYNVSEFHFIDHCSSVCVRVCVCVTERERERHTHMVGRAMFSIQRFGDEHLSKHGVDTEHLIGRLIRSHPGDAVSDRDVLVLV